MRPYAASNLAPDDFYPREPASHTVHVVNVAYNSLFLGEVVLPDWDMFQVRSV
jgi:raffinose synthase